MARLPVGGATILLLFLLRLTILTSSDCILNSTPTFKVIEMGLKEILPETSLFLFEEVHMKNPEKSKKMRRKFNFFEGRHPTTPKVVPN